MLGTDFLQSRLQSGSFKTEEPTRGRRFFGQVLSLETGLLLMGALGVGLLVMNVNRLGDEPELGVRGVMTRDALVQAVAQPVPDPANRAAQPTQQARMDDVKPRAVEMPRWGKPAERLHAYPTPHAQMEQL